jgi:glycosyltransferase involved in cell wall biosynthesis
MKNIVILHPHLVYPGGASKFMLEVANRLPKKGYLVTVILTKYNRNLVNPYKNLKFIEIGKYHTGQILFWITFPIFFAHLKKVLDGIDNKILFPQIFPPVWWAALYKLFYPKTKIVWMCQEPSAFIHSPLVIESLPFLAKMIAKILNPVLKFVDQLLVRKVDYIIGNSLYCKKLIKNTYNRISDLVAYPSVDSTIFKPTKKKENYLFTISRLDKQKNIDLIIKAYSLLPRLLIDEYQLLIGGKGKEEYSLKDLVNSLGLDTHIKFLGQIEGSKLPKYYAQAKLTIFMGENEPFGIIPVESMSSGTPVIGLNSGGVVESIVDNETGILIKRKDEKELSIVMENFLKNKKRLELMSTKARTQVLKNFSWDITVNKIYKFFQVQNLT